MLHLSFTLTGRGSAIASIADGDAKVEIEVSYLSDALGDLARAVRGILRGLPETSCSFQMEPGEHRFVFSRKGDDVLITVVQFSETFSRQRDGNHLLELRCSPRELATACINCLREVRDLHGEDGYREQWVNADFPIIEYRELLELRRRL